MLKVGWIFAKISCIKKKVTTQTENTRICWEKGKQEITKGMGEDRHYYQTVLSSPQGFQSLTLKHTPDTSVKMLT